MATVDSRDRDILEQADKTNDIFDEARDAGLAADHRVTIAATMLRLELLKTKAELDRGLSEFVLDCTACGMEMHWVQGISVGDQSTGGSGFPRRTESRWSDPHNYDSGGCSRDSRVARRAEHGARTSRHSLSCGPVCEPRSSSRARVGTASPPMSTGRTRHRSRG